MMQKTISQYLPLKNTLNPTYFVVALITLSWVALTVTTLLTRPLLPIIETRYLSIAWEMWINHHYLFSLQNGLPYADKPPLLFWFILAGWHFFGVHTWWPRILPSVFAYLNAWILYGIARQLWPERKEIHLSCFILLLGSIAWAIYANIILFDIVLSFWTLLALYGLLKIYLEEKPYAWLFYILGISLGLMTKGPVALIFILIPALLLILMVPRSQNRQKRFYSFFFLFTLIGMLLPLIWGIPAALKAGPAFTKAIFFSQTVGRVFTSEHLISYSHPHPFWWYGYLLPFYLAPWFLFLPLLKAVFQMKVSQLTPKLGFLLSAIIVIFMIMSTIQGKQIHYLIPWIPLCILFLAYLMNDLKVSRKSLWLYNFTIFILGILLYLTPLIETHLSHHKLPILIPHLAAYLIMGYALLLYFIPCHHIRTAQIYLTLNSIILIILLQTWVIKSSYAHYDIKPLAEFIGTLQEKGDTVAFFGKYQDQFQFLGRLPRSLDNVTYENLLMWANSHPNGWVLIDQKVESAFNLKVQHHFYYQNRIVGMVSSQELLSSITVPMENVKSTMYPLRKENLLKSTKLNIPMSLLVK